MGCYLLYYLVGDNKIDDKGARDISEALKINHTVIKLNLSNLKSLNAFSGGNFITDCGATILAESLENNFTLRELGLSIILAKFKYHRIQ